MRETMMAKVNHCRHAENYGICGGGGARAPQHGDGDEAIILGGLKQFQATPKQFRGRVSDPQVAGDVRVDLGVDVGRSGGLVEVTKVAQHSGGTR